ncbi:hypothetical protein [uncultured Lacinutrix sp.]|uniref:hypothetical protein n=1 Tax=uncultured Lacinutrix sp. TaxID=574032 RepID=UPI002610EC70|nr:hypothetical protein [uncultured Lacinutrix sp.]
MKYTFNMENTLDEEVTVGWFDWNDGKESPIYAKKYKISAKGHQQIDAYENVVIQISVFDAKNNPLLNGRWRNFYATKRNMKIVQNNGATSIVYTN